MDATTSLPFDIRASGHLAAELRCGVAVLLRAAADVGVVPAVRINGVPYFAAADVEALEDRVRQIQFEKDTDHD